MYGVAKPHWLYLAFKGDLARYWNCVKKTKRSKMMIDRFYLQPNERYEFQTDGQYVVVISVGYGLNIYKDTLLLATLDWLETYSCPANSGSYIIEYAGNTGTDVLLVRYLLL